MTEPFYFEKPFYFDPKEDIVEWIDYQQSGIYNFEINDKTFFRGDVINLFVPNEKGGKEINFKTTSSKKLSIYYTRCFRTFKTMQTFKSLKFQTFFDNSIVFAYPSTEPKRSTLNFIESSHRFVPFDHYSKTHWINPSDVNLFDPEGKECLPLHSSSEMEKYVEFNPKLPPVVFSGEDMWKEDRELDFGLYNSRDSNVISVVIHLYNTFSNILPSSTTKHAGRTKVSKCKRWNLF